MPKFNLISRVLLSLSIWGLINISETVSAKPVSIVNLENKGYINEDTTTKIKTAIEQYLTKKDPNVNLSDIDYQLDLVNLNGDPYQDVLVLMRGSYWCGNAGCNLLVFQGTDNKQAFKLVSHSTLIRSPIIISGTITNGWHDLIVDVKTVGLVVLKYDGKGYPVNPSLQDPLSEGTIPQGIIIFSDN